MKDELDPLLDLIATFEFSPRMTCGSRWRAGLALCVAVRRLDWSRPSSTTWATTLSTSWSAYTRHTVATGRLSRTRFGREADSKSSARSITRPWSNSDRKTWRPTVTGTASHTPLAPPSPAATSTPQFCDALRLCQPIRINQ